MEREKGVFMPVLCIGIDVASESFVASILRSPDDIETAGAPFVNTDSGFHALESWLTSKEVARADAHLFIENTGVYSEALCYQLHARGYRLSLVDPHALSKAFPKGGPKNDSVDSRRVAEYGFRFRDKLPLWEPRAEIVEQIAVVLTTREQLVEQRTALKNSRTTLARKRVQTPAANRALEGSVSSLTKQIQALEKELKRLIRSHPTILHGVTLLMSAPGVQWLLASHFAVLTRGFTHLPRAGSLAQHLGISPNDHTSGTSIRKRSCSRGYGPSIPRKLLHLAARSLRTHDAEYRRYYEDKLAAGKEKALVINNIANKHLRRLCAILKHQKPYNRNHRSVDPRLLTLA
jgi:transposase